MKIAVICLSEAGLSIALKIKSSLNCDIFFKGKSDVANSFENLSELVNDIFNKYDGLIFIMAVGIVVRTIAPVIKNKLTDPAVVVVDENCRFSISLLSGHYGGANELANKISEILEVIPVVTTASDFKNLPVPDVIAKKYCLYIENPEMLKKINSLMVRNKKVSVINNEKLNIPEWKNLYNIPKPDGYIYISSQNDPIEKFAIPTLILRPKVFSVGIGYRNGKSVREILTVISEALKKINVSLFCIKTIASIDIKSNDSVLFEIAKFLNSEVKFFSVEEIKKVEHLFDSSEFVRKNVGVGNVALPTGFLASNKGTKLEFLKKNGVTVAVFKNKDME